MSKVVRHCHVELKLPLSICLRELGEKWTLHDPPVGVKRWEVLPFVVGETAKARLHYTDVPKTRMVKVSFYAGLAANLVGDYSARSRLEDTLWKSISLETNHTPLVVLSGIDNLAYIEDSSIKLTQTIIEQIGKGSVYYFMAALESEDGSVVNSCILAGKEPPPAYAFCIGHN